MMSARNTESLHGFYTGAPKTMWRLAPSEVGADRIGHFGFFRESFKPTLWSKYLLPELKKANTGAKMLLSGFCATSDSTIKPAALPGN
jgi:hypothetical protein